MAMAFQKYQNYKHSGAEWIGEVPSHWEVKKLKFLGNIYAGLNSKKGDDFSKEYSDGIKCFIPFTNICNNVKIDNSQYQYVRVGENEIQNRVKKNDILFLMSSETLEDIAKCSIYLGDDEELYLNSFCKGFRINKSNINSEYVNYLFLSSTYRSYFSLVGRGFTRINLKQEFINDAFALIPSLAEQTAIAQNLDRKTAQIDTAIAQKQQMIALLKERRQILIHKAVTQGLDPSVKMKDSGVEWIGAVPHHWRNVEKMKFISTLKGRLGWQGLKAEEYTDQGPYVVSSAHFNNHQIYWDKCPRVSYERYVLDSNIQLKEGDLLVMKDGAKMGKLAFVEKLPDLACLNSHLLLLRPIIKDDKKSYIPKFLFYLFQTNLFQDYVLINGTGSTFLGISQEAIGNFQVCLPSNEEQVKIIEYIEAYSAKIDTAIHLKEQEIEKLKEYKGSLINSVVTGKVRVVE